MSSPDDHGKDRLQHAYNLTLASVAGQVGCLTLVIVIAALFIGLWLDNTLNTKPIFTLILMIGSVPLTLILMFKIVTTATNHMKSDQPTHPVEKQEEEINRD
jgi:F0F1-type ATP synthase assembly protein I